MPLPGSDIVWPPVSMMHAYSKMAEWAAWYSGDPARLIAVYEHVQAANAQTIPWWRFWSRARAGREGAQRALIHVPLAGDLASTSAALLFGEPMTFRVRPEGGEDDDCEPMMDPETGVMMDPMTGQPHASATTPFEAAMAKAKAAATKKPKTPEDVTAARLLEIIEQGGMHSRLVEAAEGAAAIGGVYIYPVWDEDLRPFPIMAVAQSDMAVPEFKFGILTAVTFHRTVQGDTFNRVLRLIERHEVEGTGDSRKCVVLSGLYQGTEDRLGTNVGIGVGDYQGNRVPPARIELPFPELDVEYIPNIRPNRLWRAEYLGVSDYQGAETLLDSLDETYASLMRDIRLAKARILVPREYLRPDPDTKTPTFDIDQEIYVGMDMEPGLAQDARAMMAHQFEIRYQEHLGVAENLIDRIVSNAGYAPNSIGRSEKGTGTGTALRISEHKTILTLRRKSTWWRTAVSNLLYHMLLIDKEVFGGKAVAIRPTVLLSDSIIDNPLELAQTAMALKTAESASIETRVRIVHPDWSDTEVEEEVERIKDDGSGAASPSITTMDRGSFGRPGQDPAAASTNLPTTPKPTGPVPTNPPPPQIPTAK